MVGVSTWEPLTRGGVLDGAGSVEEIGTTVLSALVADPAINRAGIAVGIAGGRQLRFLASERLEAGMPSWCVIDGMDDVPLVRAMLTGQPVLFRDLTELASTYPALVERQRALGARAVAALPLTLDGTGLGGILISFASAQRFPDEQREILMALAERTAVALRAVSDAAARGGYEDVEPVGRPEPAVAPGDRRATMRMPLDMAAAREARRFLGANLAAWGLGPEVLDPAELCLSEVVTNAILHSGTAPTVVLSLTGGRLRVAVHDGGHSGLVHRRPVPAPDAVGGRGLLLVDRLCSSWGSEQTPRGTTVWFELQA